MPNPMSEPGVSTAADRGVAENDNDEAPEDEASLNVDSGLQDGEIAADGDFHLPPLEDAAKIAAFEEEEEEEEESGDTEADVDDQSKNAEKPAEIGGAGDIEKMEEEEAFNFKNGHALLRYFNLRRLKVCGDGSCWVYAMLAAVGLLEHADPIACRDPTPLDRGMDLLCRQVAKQYLEDHTSRRSSSALPIAF